VGSLPGRLDTCTQPACAPGQPGCSPGSPARAWRVGEQHTACSGVPSCQMAHACGRAQLCGAAGGTCACARGLTPPARSPARLPRRRGVAAHAPCTRRRGADGGGAAASASAGRAAGAARARAQPQGGQSRGAGAPQLRPPHARGRGPYGPGAPLQALLRAHPRPPLRPAAGDAAGMSGCRARWSSIASRAAVHASASQGARCTVRTAASILCAGLAGAACEVVDPKP